MSSSTRAAPSAADPLPAAPEPAADRRTRSAIQTLYTALTGRAASAEELSAWEEKLGAGTPFEDLVEALSSASDVEPVQAHPIRAALIEAHRLLWARIPDAEAVRVWDGQIAEGASFDKLLLRMAEASPGVAVQDAVLAYAEAADAEARGRAVIAAIWVVATGTRPDPDEVETWVDRAKRGLSWLDIFSELTASPAALAFETARTSRALTSAYRHILGRGAKRAELDGWLRRLEQGERFPHIILQLGEQPREGVLDELAEQHRLVRAVYQLAVDRTPGEADLKVWSANFLLGVSELDFLLDMALSPESRSLKTVPLRQPRGRSDRIDCAISSAYALILGRPAGDAEIELWIEAFVNGRTVLDLIERLRRSPEAKAAEASKLRQFVGVIYRVCLRRTAHDSEIEHWIGRIESGLPAADVLLQIDASPEAERIRMEQDLGPGLGDAEFAHSLYDILLERGPAAPEVQHWVERLGARTISRVDLVRGFFNERLSRKDAPPESNDPSVTSVMGTGRTTNLAEWEALAAKPPETRALGRRLAYRAHPVLKREPGVLVSCIASLYRGREFIAQFLENITTQTIFQDHCELIIVDADSPEDEISVIQPYLDRHPNIRYQRINYRIGIYEAWNVGIEMSRGQYITNTNMDDLRRRDSLELQAATLDQFPFADVVYQDFYYTYQWDLPFEEVASMNVRSNVPIITPHNMLMYNSPHNAPMWRRRIHDEIGLFDGSFRSAGDYDFWLRCLAAGKTFYKINDPHVVYYQNAQGLSTQAESRGIEEARRITRKYSKILLKDALADLDTLADSLDVDLRPLHAQLANVSKYDVVQAALVQLAASPEGKNARA